MCIRDRHTTPLLCYTRYPHLAHASGAAARQALPRPRLEQPAHHARAPRRGQRAGRRRRLPRGAAPIA
eukprot:3294211-Prymnesium_polylepis.1